MQLARAAQPRPQLFSCTHLGERGQRLRVVGPPEGAHGGLAAAPEEALDAGHAQAVHHVAREAKGHRLGGRQRAPLLKDDAKVDVHHLGSPAGRPHKGC